MNTQFEVIKHRHKVLIAEVGAEPSFQHLNANTMTSRETAVENAQRIVRMLNAHDYLVAACRAALELPAVKKALENYEAMKSADCQHRDAGLMINDALLMASGGPASSLNFSKPLAGAKG